MADVVLPEIKVALSKIDQALQALNIEGGREPSTAVSLAVAALESAKMDLLGQKPS